MHKSGEAGIITISYFSSINVLSHSTERFRRGALLCLKKCLVSKKPKVRRRGGGPQDFPSFFCVTMPKNFVREPFNVSELFWSQSQFESETTVSILHHFPSKTFCFTIPKLFLEKPFRVSEYFSFQKISQRTGRRGSITVS